MGCGFWFVVCGLLFMIDGEQWDDFIVSILGIRIVQKGLQQLEIIDVFFRCIVQFCRGIEVVGMVGVQIIGFLLCLIVGVICCQYGLWQFGEYGFKQQVFCYILYSLRYCGVRLCMLEWSIYLWIKVVVGRFFYLGCFVVVWSVGCGLYGLQFFSKCNSSLEKRIVLQVIFYSFNLVWLREL